MANDSTVFEKMTNFFMDLGRYRNVGTESLNNIKPINNDTFIIGAGWCRSGTSSLQIALARLGHHAYHMREVSKSQNIQSHVVHWTKVGAMKHSKKQQHNVTSFSPSEWNKTLVAYDWNLIFGDSYNGAVDFPAAAFYGELMQHYQGHYKVILTVRDDSKQWFESTKKAIYPITSIAERSWFFNLCSWLLVGAQIGSFMWYTHTGLIFDGKNFNDPDDEQYIRRKYDEWIESVKAHVPRDKLLIFNVKDGWEPLCTFLEKPIPTGLNGDEEPFPRCNETQNMIAISRHMRKVEVVTNTLLLASIVALIAYVFNTYIRFLG